ncbi:acetoacetate--CoA ligase [Endozoicomonas numazuensis]|uniref:Acetoacetyl-CoA synthetase n=1 Tax=Endozoicomonas numazuensis TaxID=1137799 RepID=A0A081NMD4_9GAMM|nr:acetoacetate--CoA ligase [Endozoicomonas numazuensis]KEQ19607.1 acetoacetyl-CoA synthetase [Endozoicomonas numazuensis]
MTQLWTPDESRVQSSNLHAFIQSVNDSTAQMPIAKEKLTDYHSLYDWSVSDRNAFWESLAKFVDIQFHNQPSDTCRNDVMPGAQWFPDSTLNYAEHMLRHGADTVLSQKTAQSKKKALIFRREDGHRTTLTYSELLKAVAAVQAGLKAVGVVKGDRVAAFMPNCPETLIMMLATTALGAIWSSCSPDFGIQGVLDRFGQIAPKVLLSIDGYFYGGKKIQCLKKVQSIQEQIPSIEQTVIVPFLEGKADISALTKSSLYDHFIIPTKNTPEFVPVSFNHPLFIMYSSGTTGVPKCIVHGHGGTLLQHLKELSLHTDLKPEDTIFYFSTCGWMMWNWLVSSLALGATVVLYDGSPFYPEPRSLIDMAEEEAISIFGTSAKYIAALEKAGVKPAESHALPKLKAILSTGSPLLHESFDYVYRDIKKDLCLSSISGGTDIVSCFALGCPILPVNKGELQCRGLGMDVQFVNPEGKPLHGEKGELTCQTSFPSMPIGFWNDPEDKKYHKAYFSQFPGVWAHGDFGELTENKGVIIHGRADAVLNPGGVRIGTAEIYRQVEKVEEVLESIAIGQEWDGDVRVILFVKLREGVSLADELINKIKQTIRANTTPRHVPAVVLQTPDIPRTISGKIVELAVRDVVHDKPVANTDALANPEALDYFRKRPELIH